MDPPRWEHQQRTSEHVAADRVEHKVDARHDVLEMLDLDIDGGIGPS